jgi:hypothetical protein
VTELLQEQITHAVEYEDMDDSEPGTLPDRITSSYDTYRLVGVVYAIDEAGCDWSWHGWGVHRLTGL